jgi:hypothetical protein
VRQQQPPVKRRAAAPPAARLAGDARRRGHRNHAAFFRLSPSASSRSSLSRSLRYVKKKLVAALLIAITKMGPRGQLRLNHWATDSALDAGRTHTDGLRTRRRNMAKTKREPICPIQKNTIHGACCAPSDRKLVRLEKVPEAGCPEAYHRKIFPGISSRPPNAHLRGRGGQRKRLRDGQGGRLSFTGPHRKGEADLCVKKGTNTRGSVCGKRRTSTPSSRPSRAATVTSVSRSLSTSPIPPASPAALVATAAVSPAPAPPCPARAAAALRLSSAELNA